MISPKLGVKQVLMGFLRVTPRYQEIRTDRVGWCCIKFFFKWTNLIWHTVNPNIGGAIHLQTRWITPPRFAISTAASLPMPLFAPALMYYKAIASECPRSLVHFYMVNIRRKFCETSWTDKLNNLLLMYFR